MGAGAHNERVREKSSVGLTIRPLLIFGEDVAVGFDLFIYFRDEALVSRRLRGGIVLELDPEFLYYIDDFAMDPLGELLGGYVLSKRFELDSGSVGIAAADIDGLVAPQLVIAAEDVA